MPSVANNQPSLTLIMPALNEAKFIFDNLLLTHKILSAHLENFEIILVDDGSKDSTTSETLRACAIHSNIKCITSGKNRGKGNAIKLGINQAQSELVAFLDSDLDISPIHIKDFMERLSLNHADVVIGSKLHNDSVLDYPPLRRWMSTSYYYLLLFLFDLNVKDTQTGLKLFRSKPLKSVIDQIQLDRFAFDIELLLLLHDFGCKIVDAPVTIRFSRGQRWGRISIKDILKVFKDTLGLYLKRRANLKKVYPNGSTSKLTLKRTLHFFVGTEAELIKLHPVFIELNARSISFKVISSGQHDIRQSPFLKIANGGVVDYNLWDQRPIKKNILGLLHWYIKTEYSGSAKLRKDPSFNSAQAYFVVHGDTVSTLMGARISRKLKIPFAHIEAGYRSFNFINPFPEEFDRYMSSTHADVAFSPGPEPTKNLQRIKGLAVDTVYNTVLETVYFALSERNKSEYILPAEKKPYFLFMFHRQENLINRQFLSQVVDKIINLSGKIDCVFIYHEYTKEVMMSAGLFEKLSNAPGITAMPRISYLNFINKVFDSKFVITDGAGNQQEMSYLGKPCLLLRKQVEGTEGLGSSTLLYGDDVSSITSFYENYEKYEKPIIQTNVKPSKIIVDCLEKRVQL